MGWVMGMGEASDYLKPIFDAFRWLADHVFYTPSRERLEGPLREKIESLETKLGDTRQDYDQAQIVIQQLTGIRDKLETQLRNNNAATVTLHKKFEDLRGTITHVVYYTQSLSDIDRHYIERRDDKYDRDWNLMLTGMYKISLSELSITENKDLEDNELKTIKKIIDYEQAHNVDLGTIANLVKDLKKKR